MKLHPGPPYRQQGSEYLGQQLLPSWVLRGELDRKWSSWDLNSRRMSVSQWWFDSLCHGTLPLLSFSPPFPASFVTTSVPPWCLRICAVGRSCPGGRLHRGAVTLGSLPVFGDLRKDTIETLPRSASLPGLSGRRGPHLTGLPSAGLSRLRCSFWTPVELSRAVGIVRVGSCL